MDKRSKSTSINFYKVPDVWPNGSGIFEKPTEDGRLELGRIFRVENGFKVLSYDNGNYIDLGVAVSFLEGMALLPEGNATPQPGVKKKIKTKSKRKLKKK